MTKITACPSAKKCSGCQLSNLTYERQLEWKQKDVTGLLGEYLLNADKLRGLCVGVSKVDFHR